MTENSQFQVALISLVHEADCYKHGTRTREDFAEAARIILRRAMGNENEDFWNALVCESATGSSSDINWERLEAVS